MPEALMKKLRIALADNSEPYIYGDDELEAVLEMACAAYSKYRPAKRKGVITVVQGVSEYMLPDDYQTWVCGLEKYSVCEKTVELGFVPAYGHEITYSYLADRKPTEVPAADLPLIIDYGFCFIVDAAVKETSDISALKLGKGLQIQFDNIKELSKAAERRLANFNEKLQSCSGGWA